MKKFCIEEKKRRSSKKEERKKEKENTIKACSSFSKLIESSLWCLGECYTHLDIDIKCYCNQFYVCMSCSYWFHHLQYSAQFLWRRWIPIDCFNSNWLLQFQLIALPIDCLFPQSIATFPCWPINCFLVQSIASIRLLNLKVVLSNELLFHYIVPWFIMA